MEVCFSQGETQFFHKPFIHQNQKHDENVRIPAEDMDDNRQKAIAYQYLCHLEEAKMWLQVVLKEQLPPTTQLEEYLRNGVCLAKLGHILAPYVVPLNKIFDKDLKRYEAAGLQFRHTDNINYWLKSLDAIKLPKTFQPETTDVYDKKNMPRVIYCVHALSTHLFKMGKAPLIQDLYGKITFTDDEINAMRLELKKYNIDMPAFQKIGGLLAGDVAEDAAVLHAAVIAINEAIDSQDVNSVFETLTNPAAHIFYVEPHLIKLYCQVMREAKTVKVQSALNRSLNDSYVADVYDEYLTQAEIQGHITAVTVGYYWNEIVEAAEQQQYQQMMKALKAFCLQLQGLDDTNSSFYVAEICKIKDLDFENGDLRIKLQEAINQGNCAAITQRNCEGAVTIINNILERGDEAQLISALGNPILHLRPRVLKHAASLYFEELKADREHCQRDLLLCEIGSSLTILNAITAVTDAVDSENVERTWDTLINLEVPISDLLQESKVKYWQALSARRKHKVSRNAPCPILTYFDIQDCVDLVNKQHDTNNQLILCLHQLNVALQNNDNVTLLEALKHPLLKLNLNKSNSDLYLMLIKMLKDNKSNGENELWLEDIQGIEEIVKKEISYAKRVCHYLAKINNAILCSNVPETIGMLQSSKLGFSGCSSLVRGNFKALSDLKSSKMRTSSFPWVKHAALSGFPIFLNLETGQVAWQEPKGFQEISQYLSKFDIQKVLSGPPVHIIIKLQARIRGFLTRRRLYKRKLIYCVIKIQAWWRGVIQRQKFKQLLLLRKCATQHCSVPEYWIQKHARNIKSIIKIQAAWRAHQVRRAFKALVYDRQPPFWAIRYFSQQLYFGHDDYNREMELQDLKGQVGKAIRRNQSLSQQLDAMDLKIGLLVQNRITLQDVEAHGSHMTSTLNDYPDARRGLKALTKESRQLLEGYQHLFYLLQTDPHYLARLMCLPRSHSTKFLRTVILALFNFGSNTREDYLLLKLFRTAMVEEIKSKVQKPMDAITDDPLVLALVVSYARHVSGQNPLKEMLGPLIQKIIDSKNVSMDTNPVDIYKSWRNQQEMETGKVSELPISINEEQALKYPEVQERLRRNISDLKKNTIMFLNRITASRDIIPYGMLFMAKVLRDSLSEKFPKVPEKDILKVVGNLLYYMYINSAIVAPDTMDIINLSADRSLSYDDRRNLASVAKLLHFAASKKGFESQHLKCFNPLIIEWHETFKKFFRYCCEVEDLEDHFRVHKYSEATLISRPIIYISLQEMCDTHKLLQEHLSKIALGPMDPLYEILEELGSIPNAATLFGSANGNEVAMAQTVCLTLVNRFEVQDTEDPDTNKRFIRAKELLVKLLPVLKGSNLCEALDNIESAIVRESYNGSKRIKEDKQELQILLAKLELSGLVSQKDGYQNLVSAVTRDMFHKGRHRQLILKELQTLRETKSSLDCKTEFYEEQVIFYNQYISKCLENLSAAKRNVHSIKTNNKRHLGRIKSKATLKYTAAQLHEKGVLVEVEGLPSSQFKNVQFEISPTENSGVFTILGKFMGVEIEKIDINIQHLLQLQYEGVSIMDIFRKAKVNVNLLLFLLNHKFYGK